MKRTKNKELYRIINNVGMRDKACKVIQGTDAIKSRLFMKILKRVIKEEHPRIVGLNAIYIGAAASVMFNYAKDYNHFITKALKAYNTKL
tara:strand:+ start:187 stop:456 length:270 start_codon:yes stop_codon:yes gene_type:complete